MQVLGQFNLGFMVTRAKRAAAATAPRAEEAPSSKRQRVGERTTQLGARVATEGEGDDVADADADVDPDVDPDAGADACDDEAARSSGDLFIIDQHAADEKFRFETLQASTVIHTQRLLAPLPLHLTAADELLVIDHVHVFHANGFQMAIDADAPPTQRLKLLTLPFSRHTVFGPSDVHELVTLLAENPHTGCRLPKLRAVFASRACRSAVMIGTALERSKMSSLTRQLATLEQPWNCPHGRPTVRHLIDLTQLTETQAACDFERSRA